MATEAEKRKHRCCFTGHRPEKLNRPESEIKRELEREILQAIDEGFGVFISGMARGVDIWAAELVLLLKQRGYPVKLICAVPYDGFERLWENEWKERYNAVMESVDWIRFICPGYSRSCFQLRNEWMVKHSARVLAVFNGESGGTRNTIDYARRAGIGIIEIRG